MKKTAFTFAKPVLFMLLFYFLYNQVKAQQSLIFFENYHIHTDRKFYVAGEEVQFKIYSLIDKKDQPQISSVIYLSLVDDKGNAVENKRYIITKNGCIGTFLIPENLHSGYYNLYAYTKWQRNFGSANYAGKKLFVINSQQGIYRNSENAAGENLDIEIFPDGGILQLNADNKMLFYCRNKFGELVKSEGKIFDQHDSLVKEIFSSDSGIGSFVFHPKADFNYKVVFNSGGLTQSKYIADFQIIDSQFKIDDTKNNYVDIGWSLKSDLAPTNDTLIEETDYNGLNYLILFKSLPDKEFSISVPKKHFVAGLNRITIKSAYNKIYFSKKILIQPNEEIKFDIKTNKKSFSTRDKVDVKIKSIFNGQISRNCIFSVSVSLLENQNDSIDFEPFNDISYNKLLQASNPGFNSLKTGKNDMQNNLLLVNNNIDTNENFIQFFPETNGAYLAGTLTDQNNNQPVNHKTLLFVTLFDSLRTTRIIESSADNGKFIVPIKSNNFSEILFQMHQGYAEKYNIQFDNDFETRFPVKKMQIPLFRKGTQDYLKRLMLNYQIESHYADIKQDTSFQKKLNFLFYGTHNTSYYLSKYIDLPNMEEIFNNLILSINVKKGKEKYSLTIFDKNKRILNFNPLVLVDGIPVLNIETMMKIRPSDVERIEIINSNYALGENIFGGILSIFSKENNMAGLKLSGNSHIVDYELIDNAKYDKTKNTDYLLNNDKNLPDLRNTLYWNPELKTDENGEATLSFFTSDEIGKFVIRIEGLSEDALPGAGSCIFEVKK